MRRVSDRYLRVMKAKVAVAAAVSMGAAVLLTGCGKAVVADPVDPGVPAPSRPVAAPPCPVIDETAPQAPPTLIDGTPANTAEAQALSQAFGELGYGAFADVYSEMIVDHPVGRVAVCVTDLVRGRALVAAAHAVDPEADMARADLYLSTYSHRTLRAAGDGLIDLEAGFPIFSVGGSRGEAVEVTSTKEGAASAEFKAKLEKATGGIPVTVTKGEQPTLLEGPLTAP